jgi:hypothetical protein
MAGELTEILSDCRSKPLIPAIRILRRSSFTNLQHANSENLSAEPGIQRQTKGVGCAKNSNAGAGARAVYSSTIGSKGETSSGGSEQSLMVDNLKHISKSCGHESKSGR